MRRCTLWILALAFVTANCSGSDARLVVGDDAAELPDIWTGMALADQWPDVSGLADLASQAELIVVVQPTGVDRSETVAGAEQLLVSTLRIVTVVKEPVNVSGSGGVVAGETVELVHGTFFLDPNSGEERAVVTDEGLRYLLFLEPWSLVEDDLGGPEYVTVSGPNGIFIDLAGTETDYATLNTENRSFPATITITDVRDALG